VGTLNGYRAAIGLLAEVAAGENEGARVALGWPGGTAGKLNLVSRGMS
jgi:hypothetical protein